MVWRRPLPHRPRQMTVRAPPGAHASPAFPRQREGGRSGESGGDTDDGFDADGHADAIFEDAVAAKVLFPPPCLDSVQEVSRHGDQGPPTPRILPAARLGGAALSRRGVTS